MEEIPVLQIKLYKRMEHVKIVIMVLLIQMDKKLAKQHQLQNVMIHKYRQVMEFAILVHLTQDRRIIIKIVQKINV